eukprot:g1503.t1
MKLVVLVCAILSMLGIVSSMNPQRFGHCSVIAGESLYVYGGISFKPSNDVHTAGSIMTNFQKFNMRTKTWSKVETTGDMQPTARAFHTCNYNASTSSITLFGGTNQAGILQRKSIMHTCGLGDVWSFNTMTNVWSELIAHKGNCENSSFRGVSFNIATVVGIMTFMFMIMI